MDRILMNAIEICAIALAIIILCWIIGKCTDRNTGRGSVFSERHPKLNMVISCAIVIIFGMICYVFISYIGYRIKSTIHWMTYVTSKMDAVVIVTFITGAVSIIGVIISSIIAKIIDYRKSRQDYLAMKREIPYGEFVEMIYKVQSNAKDKGRLMWTAVIFLRFVKMSIMFQIRRQYWHLRLRWNCLWMKQRICWQVLGLHCPEVLRPILLLHIFCKIRSMICLKSMTYWMHTDSRYFRFFTLRTI